LLLLLVSAAAFRTQPPMRREKFFKIVRQSPVGLKMSAAPDAVTPDAAAVDTADMLAPTDRHPYVLSGLERPTWRGAAMGWMHRTRTWYVLVSLYVGLAAWLGRASADLPLTATQLAIRVFVAAASSANVFISDRYHNADQRGKRALTSEAETLWLRCDYLGISMVLTSLMWLWSSNVAWVGSLRVSSALCGLATLALSVVSRLVVPRKAGHTAAKLIMAVQFVGFLGHLAITVVRAAPAKCAVNSIIFFIYMPGLLLYAIKWPKRSDFGFHEWFHSSVLLGHVSSMICDLRDIAMPCARCAGMLG